MSVKKKATGRPSARVEVEVPGSTQTAAERKAVEAEVSALIAKFAPEKTKLVAAVRKALQKRLPTAYEVVYEYRSWFVISISPSEHGYEGVLGIRGDADGVKFYFSRGKELPDPEKLLKGSAQVRFIDLEGASTLTRPAVARLIEEAIARNTVPFASAGRGPVLFVRHRPRSRRSVAPLDMRLHLTMARFQKRFPMPAGKSECPRGLFTGMFATTNAGLSRT